MSSRPSLERVADTLERLLLEYMLFLCARRVRKEMLTVSVRCEGIQRS